MAHSGLRALSTLVSHAVGSFSWVMTWSARSAGMSHTEASLAYCRRSTPILTVSAKHCFGCDELREAKWFYSNPKAPTGLQARCMPCHVLLQLQRRERGQREGTPDPPIEKRCRTCEKTLPVSSFSVKYGNKDGFSNECRECNVKSSAAWRADRKERFGEQPAVLPAGEERVCSLCGKAKPWSQFHKKAGITFGIVTKCIDCVRVERRAEQRRTQTSSGSGN